MKNDPEQVSRSDRRLHWAPPVRVDPALPWARLHWGWPSAVDSCCHGLSGRFPSASNSQLFKADSAGVSCRCGESKGLNFPAVNVCSCVDAETCPYGPTLGRELWEGRAGDGRGCAVPGRDRTGPSVMTAAIRRIVGAVVCTPTMCILHTFLHLTPRTTFCTVNVMRLISYIRM